MLPIRYRQAGQPLLSVTQALTLAGRIDAQWFTPEACARGQAVHAWTDAYDRGEDQPLPAEWAGYSEAYLTFLAQCRPVYRQIEWRVQAASLGLAGRIDRVCSSLFGSPAILDFKTGSPYPWHALQLAGYMLLCTRQEPAVPTGGRYTVQLSANGRYRLHRHEDPLDLRRFQHDLARVRGTVYPDGDFWLPRPS